MARNLMHFLMALLALGPLAARAGTLEVGPGKPYGRIEDALAKAKPGDEILVSPNPRNEPYHRTALLVKTPRVRIRAADPKATIPLDGQGFDYSGSGQVPRAIVQFDPGATGATLEGFELTNARNASHNGAGVRINQANDVTVRRCRIHDNDMGIMSNGAWADKTGANQLIEGCLITANGSLKEPGQNHNLYLGGTSVTVRACEIARSLTGHNLKSRAHLNVVAYNYLHDSANRELDLVDAKGTSDAPASDAILLGNTITKAPRMAGNKAVLHFGQDGKADHTGTLYLVHNTITTPYVSPVVDLSAPGATVVFLNNLVLDQKASQAGVLVSARDGAVLEKCAGEGNDLPAGFRVKIPAGVKLGPVVPWDRLTFPWSGDKRPALEELVTVGTLRLRVPPVGSGAGIMPKAAGALAP